MGIFDDAVPGGNISKPIMIALGALLVGKLLSGKGNSDDAATQPANAPAFFRPGGDVEKIAPGSVVLVTPFSSKESTDAMYWQATANYRFRMPEGDAFTPGPFLGPHPSFMKSTLDDLDAGKPVTPTPEVTTPRRVSWAHEILWSVLSRRVLFTPGTRTSILMMMA